MAFGINDITTKPVGIDHSSATEIIKKLGNLCRDGVSPLVIIDHTIIDFRGNEILLIYVNKSAVKPVQIANKTIEESYIRSGSTTRKASRQEIGGLMLNSKIPVF